MALLWSVSYFHSTVIQKKATKRKNVLQASRSHCHKWSIGNTRNLRDWILPRFVLPQGENCFLMILPSEMWKQIKIRCWIFLFITLVTFIWPSLVNANCNYCLVKTSLCVSVINYPFCVWWIPEKLKETTCVCHEGSEFLLVLIIIRYMVMSFLLIFPICTLSPWYGTRLFYNIRHYNMLS